MSEITCPLGGGFGPYYEPWRNEDVVARQRMWAWRLEQVWNVSPKGKLLEVGAGDGNFIELASRAGYAVAATEFSEAAVGNIRERVPGIEVYQGEIEKLELPTESFDVIVVWHSLEHMRFPFRALSAMHRALKSGGSLFIAVPNRNNHLMRFFIGLLVVGPIPCFPCIPRRFICRILRPGV